MREPNRIAVALALLALAPAEARAEAEGESPRPPPSVSTGVRIDAPRVPSLELLDQHGRTVSTSEVFGAGRVVVGFAFTHCSTVCTPLTATFAAVQKRLAPDAGVKLVTISLDPARDTPERLAAYAARFGAQEGWSFLTGRPAEVAELLRALGATPGREGHAPLVLVAEPRAGQWRRLTGIPPPSAISATLDELVAAPASGAARYFPDVALIDQHGRSHRFFSDLLRGHKVLIHFGFASCQTACPPILQNLRRLQERLGPARARELLLLTLTVDPERDTPEALARFAARQGAAPGWHFLTGSPENVRAVLRSLGVDVADPAQHPLTVIIGNAESGHWLKAHGLADTAALAEAILRLDEPAAALR